MKNKKILIDGRPIRPPYSGVAQYTARIALNLKFDNFDYSLVTNNIKDVDEFYSGIRAETPPIVKQIDLPRPVWTTLLRHAPAGGRWLPVVREADLIHITQFEPFPKHLRTSTKKVLTIHDLIFLDHPEWFTPRNLNASNLTLSQLLQDQIDCVLTPSQFTKNRLVKTGYQGRIEVTPLAPTIHSEIISNHEQLDQIFLNKKPYFLYIGNLEPRKGLINLIRAWKNTKSKSFFRLVLAGKFAYLSDGIKAEIEKEISEGLDVVHLGYVTENEKYKLLNNAYCFVYPSEAEGFGIPIIDAMSVGLPVISCSAGSIPEVSAGCAHLVEPARTEILAEAIDFLAENVSYRNKVAKLGLEHAKKFNWHLTTSLTEQVYQDLLN